MESQGKKRRSLPKLPNDFTARSLSAEDKRRLIRPFTEEEAKEAVWSCDESKSPGPDGFNLCFWKSSWEVIKGDFIKLLQEFHENGKIPKGGNSSFITLIPKKEEACSLDDYRPISLIGSIYKVIAKILAQRLSAVMDSIISENQSAFIKGRFILDGVVILSEVIEEAKREKNGRMIFKIDFAKAYDSVEWDFIDSMLERFNFDPLWRRWMKGRLSSASANVLINGSPSDNEKNADVVKKILSLFELLSGLKVNYSKSSLMGIKIDDSKLESLANVLECRMGSIPFKYLGVKIGGRNKSVVDWNYMLKKGLGFRNIEFFNKALVGKWLWRYLEGGGSLWTKIVKSIYGELVWGDEGIRLSRKGKSGTGWWGKIISLGGNSNCEWLLNKIERRVGNGSNTSFWGQKWVGGSTLKLVFPRLFQLSSNKEARIGDLGKWVEGKWMWDLSWRRELRAREMEMVQLLYSFIANFTLCACEEDRWIWAASPDGVYTTKAAYSLIVESRREATAPLSYPAEFVRVWKTKAPQKAILTAWRLLRNRLATCDNLEKRKVPLGEEEKKCQFCNLEMETAEHLFLRCSKTAEIWDTI
ncbi:uncharacterized protein LOC131023530 [Salvia miltiorrhiza]|uniref:uncharacterized protein LOC131023530 n=1 Tax=Salvia miltiorrhiza TaxID=226208 RepID=UPI0025AB79BA|nr:uncharacterized protein LOC131023530 [Salvia miltiorrhiza]